MTTTGVGVFSVILAVTALGGVGLGRIATASPALSRPGSAVAAITSARPQSTVRRSLDPQDHRFDLRPTKDLSSTGAQGGDAAPAPAPPLSAIHHFGVDDRRQLVSLGTVDESFRSMNQPEAFARRVHQEGLPVARLWETKSSLLSIGLNQKGKPGLWLVQRTH